MARARRRGRVPPHPQGRRALDLLRGSPDRQRPARSPPRLGPGVQGPLSPVRDDARPQRPAQGRVGLPRAPRRARGRKGAGAPLEARDRGLRGGRVQPALPRLGAALRRGLVGAHDPIGHLDRHGRRLLDALERLRRVGLVAALADLAEGPALRGPQGQPLLRPLRHRPLVPRARSARRLSRHRRPVGLRAVPAGRRSRPPRSRRRRPAGVDHHTVDAHLERGRRCRCRHRLHEGAGRGLRFDRARPARGRGPPARRRRARCDLEGPPAGRPPLPAPVRPARRAQGDRRLARRRGRLRQHRRRHGHRAPGPRLRRGGRGRRPGRGPARHQPGRRRRHLRRAGTRVARAVRQGCRSRHHRRPGGTWAARARAPLHPQLPALLALWHPAHLLGQDLVVRAHVDDARRAAAGQRDHRLAPRSHQARTVRQVARGQRRLGAVA